MPIIQQKIDALSRRFSVTLFLFLIIQYTVLQLLLFWPNVYSFAYWFLSSIYFGIIIPVLTLSLYRQGKVQNVQDILKRVGIVAVCYFVALSIIKFFVFRVLLHSTTFLNSLGRDFITSALLMLLTMISIVFIYKQMSTHKISN